MNIGQSLKKVLESPDNFGDVFYDVFLTRHPEAKGFFQNVNMKRQGVLLTMALNIVEQYYRTPYPAMEKYLQYLGTRHLDRAIPQEMYAKWTAAMLDTLAAFHGSDWHDELAAQWKEAIGRATELMFEGYDKRFHL
jgi:hemoglobin-like flavoprotein